jgi:hypothetical protein
MLSLFVFSSQHTSLPAPALALHYHEILRPIISPATALESTLPQVLILNNLKSPGISIYKKPGAGGPVIVNQISDEEICPDERSEEGPLFTRVFTRDDRRFRPCRKRSLRSLRRYLFTSLSPDFPTPKEAAPTQSLQRC